MIFDDIVKAAPPETVIPKPQAKKNFVVKGVGTRRGEDALIYFIPNHKRPEQPLQKGVTRTEWDKALDVLHRTGEFTRQWFEQNLERCAREGGCNFTTIGGIFELMRIAHYAGAGKYVATRSS